MKSRGFTIIELLTAMAILAIVAALALPFYNNIMEGARITSTTNDIVEAITMARSEAVRQRQIVRVAPTDGVNWANGWSVFDAADTNLGQFDAVPPSVTVTPSTAFVSIQFQPSGMRVIDVGAVTINVCGQSGRGRIISLSATGSTQITRVDNGC